MKITRTLLSSASALAMFAGSVSPAFAYGDFKPPIPTTALRQQVSVVRELYADAYSSILELARMQREPAVSDTTGRSMLARAQVRAAQRNFHRHILGYLRGMDYRILNVSGDERRRGLMTAGNTNLPLSLVQTGGGNSANDGDWMWDRPTRRDIMDNQQVGCVFNRQRNILKEMSDGIDYCEQ